MNSFIRPAQILPALVRIAPFTFFKLGILAAACLALPSRSHAAVLASGVFQSKEAGITASGNFEIQEYAGKYTLVVKSDFQVSEGPDLFFAFHPLPAAQITGTNAKTMALKIDPQLAKLSGGQTVDLPNDFDVAKYASLIIHCWKYNHLYAAGTVKLQTAAALAPKGGNAALPAKSEAGRFQVHRESGRLWARDGKANPTQYDFSGRTGIPVR